MAVCNYIACDRLDLNKTDRRSYVELRSRILLSCFQRKLLMGHKDGHHYDLSANDPTSYPNYKSVSVDEILQISKQSETWASDDSDILGID